MASVICTISASQNKHSKVSGDYFRVITCQQREVQLLKDDLYKDLLCQPAVLIVAGPASAHLGPRG